MKIAIASILFNQRGGSERRTYQLTKGLISAGHDVEIFAAEVLDMDLKVKINIVPTSSGPAFLKIKNFAGNLRKALAGTDGIDVVHNQIRPFTNGVVTVGGGCHAEYLERMGKRFHFLNPRDGVVLKMEREAYRPGGCAAVITNSELSRAGILKHYPMPPERVFVAYNGVDLSKFQPDKVRAARASTRAKLGLSGDGPVALFLGSGFERKGIGTVIKSLSVVRTMEREIRELKVVVAGKDDPKPWRKMASRLGVSDMLVFAGETRNPEEFYGMADVFVLPTAFDPFSNATLEAMACGLPVITTRQNGVSEIIRDGENGFVMERHDDASALAGTLAYLGCEKARRRAGEEARRTAEDLTWDKTLARTLAVYDSVIKDEYPKR